MQSLTLLHTFVTDAATDTTTSFGNIAVKYLNSALITVLGIVLGVTVQRMFKRIDDRHEENALKFTALNDRLDRHSDALATQNIALARVVQGQDDNVLTLGQVPRLADTVASLRARVDEHDRRMNRHDDWAKEQRDDLMKFVGGNATRFRSGRGTVSGST